MLRGAKVGGRKKKKRRKDETRYKGNDFKGAHHPFLIHPPCQSQSEDEAPSATEVMSPIDHIVGQEGSQLN